MEFINNIEGHTELPGTISPTISPVDWKEDLILYECDDCTIDEDHDFNKVKQIFPDYHYDMCKFYYVGKRDIDVNIITEEELDSLTE